MIKIGTNNLKRIYFITLHSTSVERELWRIEFMYNMPKYLHFLKHHKILGGEMETVEDL